MSGHGIAIVALTWPTVGGDCAAQLRLQCECGWHRSLPEVTTFEALRQAVDEHLAAAR